MGRGLTEAYPKAEEVFAQADAILDVPLSRICFEGPADALNDTWNTQPAVLTTSVAAWRVINGKGVDSAIVAGHSLGEFSALVAAGVLTFADALRLVRERGRLMKEANRTSPGGMAAVIGLSVAALSDICETAAARTGQTVCVANDNCPGQVVISGTETALAAAMALAEERDARRVIRLNVSIAAHSPLMARAAEAFQVALQQVEFQAPHIPIVFNAMGRPLQQPDEIRAAVAGQLTSAVRWTESVRWMLAQGVEAFVEVGPGQVLSGLVRRIDRSVARMSTADVLGLA
jgi:[acyl-carrier-protein] S-malonyltransferase